MPSGPDHWHNFWQSDRRALTYLRKRGFKYPGGVIQHPKGLAPDVLDIAAISYLVAEWDYDFKPTQPETK